MRLLRFISQKEYDILKSKGEVIPINTMRAWSGKNRLYAFPLGNYKEDSYLDIKEYLEVAFDIDYDYAIYLNNVYKENIVFAAYDKDMVDMTLGRSVEFDIDEDSYDTGPVYVVPEVRLTKYDLKHVEKIIKLKGNKKESAEQMQTTKYNSYAQFIKAWRENLISNVDGYRKIIEDLATIEDEELEYSKMPVGVSYIKLPIIVDGIASVKIVFITQSDNFALITPENVYDVYKLVEEEPREIKAANVGLQLAVDSAGFDTTDQEFQKLIQRSYLSSGNNSPAFELSSILKAEIEDMNEMDEEDRDKPTPLSDGIGEDHVDVPNKELMFKEPEGFEADEEIEKNMEAYSKFSKTTDYLDIILEKLSKSPEIVRKNVYAKYLGENKNVLMVVVDNKAVYKSFINMPKKAKDTLTKFGESIRLNKDTQILDTFIKDGKRAFILAEYAINNFWVVEGEKPIKESIYNKRIAPKKVITLSKSSIREDSRKFRLIEDSGNKKIFSLNK